jgi:hypothetical protein
MSVLRSAKSIMQSFMSWLHKLQRLLPDDPLKIVMHRTSKIGRRRTLGHSEPCPLSKKGGRCWESRLPRLTNPQLGSSFNPMPLPARATLRISRASRRAKGRNPYRSVMEKPGSSPKPLRPVSVGPSGATTQWRLT